MADDIADAVSYGLAPACVLAAALPAPDGFVLGAAHALFTWTRLVYFTWRKGRDDEGSFSGTPSNVGALTVLGAAVALPQHPTIVAAIVGAAAVSMVAFDAQYPHIGRALGTRRARAMLGCAALLITVAAAANGPRGVGAAFLLIGAGYALMPSLLNLRAAKRARREA